MLAVGQQIRPSLSALEVEQLVSSLYSFSVTSLEQLPGYHDINWFIEVDSVHGNPHVGRPSQHGYVFKVLNSLDSAKQHTDAEHAMTRHLTARDISCPRPVPTVDGKLQSLVTLQSGRHLVRLLNYIPGRRVVTMQPYRPSLLFQVGRYLATIHTALQGFRHDAMRGFQSLWSLSCLSQLRQFCFAIRDDADRKLVQDVIEVFDERVARNVNKFSHGAIHGDFNEQNLLMTNSSTDESESSSVDAEVSFAIIDFAHCSWSPYVFDVGIALMYMTLDADDISEAGGHVLAGYMSERALSQVEYDSLGLCAAARYAQSLTMGAYNHSLDPTNEYLLVTAVRGWTKLRQLWAMPPQRLANTWASVIGTYSDLKCYPCLSLDNNNNINNI